MTAAHARAALEAGVLKDWRRRGVAPANTAVAERMALLAVGEVLDALRSNPSWALDLLGLR